MKDLFFILGISFGIAFLIVGTWMWVIKITFIKNYGEIIRKHILNMSDFQEWWFRPISIYEPIKWWQLYRVTIFDIKLMNAMLALKKSQQGLEPNKIIRNNMPEEAYNLLMKLWLIIRIVFFCGFFMIIFTYLSIY
jgi:hypothetical protein